MPFGAIGAKGFLMELFSNTNPGFVLMVKNRFLVKAIGRHMLLVPPG